MNPRATTVTNSYVVTWELSGYTTNFADEDSVNDKLLDAEDDIVTTAVFLYNVNADFGDEFTTFVTVGWDENEKVFDVQEMRSYEGALPFADVKVVVRANTLRL